MSCSVSQRWRAILLVFQDVSRRGLGRGWGAQKSQSRVGRGLWGGQEGPRPRPPEARSAKPKGLGEPEPWGPHCTLIHTAGPHASSRLQVWPGGGQVHEGPQRGEGTGHSLPVAHRPREDTWAPTGLHVPERLEPELNAVTWVLKSGFSPQVGAGEGCLPPRDASTTHFAAGLTLGQEPLRTFWWRYVSLECSGIGFL